MKKSVVFLVATLMLTAAALSLVAFKNNSSGSGKKHMDSIIGTWQLESYKYGTSASSFTKITPERPHIKVITGNRFLWVTYDTGTKKILESAGGEYSLDGDNYVESIDFGYKMDSYLNSKSKFKIKVEDKVFYLTGELGDGYKIEEIWQKTIPGKNSHKKINGTWLLDSYKYGASPSSFTRVPPNRPHVELITKDQFLWATYDTTSKKILESAGGKYSFDGKNFLVTVDYGFNMDPYLGITSNYKIQLDKGMYYLSGNLIDGYKIEEIWQRVK
jgi:hypothetical protein